MYTNEEKWQLALDILKPTEKELRHGLELHENSLVFDAYGFIPLPVPQCDDRFREMAANGASRDELAYARHVLAAKDGMKDPENVLLMKETLKMAGVDAIFQNSGQEGNDIERLIRRLGIFHQLADSFPEFLTRAAFPDRILKAREEGKFALYPTTNGVPLPCTPQSTEEALNYIEVFFGLGVRMMHLTYNRRNMFGDGCAEKADAGISAFAEDAIREMNRIGMICDVAHSGLRTSYEAAKASKKPIVASHTVAGGLYPHYRSKSDEVIEAIKATGGFVGICAHPPFLGGSKKIDAFIDHIDYVARKFGVDHVAIGTDHATSFGKQGNPFPPAGKSRPIWEQYWSYSPIGGEYGGVFDHTDEEYDSMAWTNWPLYTVALVQRGYTDEEIRKIIGGNVLRVCQESLA